MDWRAKFHRQAQSASDEKEDLILFYHSVSDKHIAGNARVVKEAT